MAGRRDLAVDSLRGLAALLLVAFHCIEGPRTAGGHFGYEYFGYSFAVVRMPLFTVLSGYVYAMRPVDFSVDRGVRQFLVGKTRRLLVPLFTATATVVALRRIVGREPEASASLLELAHYFFFPYEVFWFLQGLFWVFLLVVALERLGMLQSIRRWIFVLGVITVVGPLIPGPQFFSIAIVRYLAPFFLLGLGYRRFEERLREGWWIPASVVVAVGSVLLHQANWWMQLGIPTGRTSPLTFAAGLACTLVLLRYRRAVPALARVGAHSYAIYLYHLMGIALAVRIAARFGLPSDADAAFALKFAIGLGLPAVAESVMLRFELTRVALLGLRPRAPRAHDPAPDPKPGPGPDSVDPEPAHSRGS